VAVELSIVWPCQYAKPLARLEILAAAINPQQEIACSQVCNASLDDGIRSAIGKLVPAVHGTDGDLGELVLDLVDALQKLLSSDVSAVQALGADSDGLNDVFVSGDGVLEGVEVLVEGLVVVGPESQNTH
jgi:hypothetical protein